MDVSEYRKDLVEAVKSSAQALKDFETTVFVDEAAKLLADAGEFSDFSPCHYEGVARRGRRVEVHGYSFDGADGSARLAIADWVGGDSTSRLTITEARKILLRAKAFVEESVLGQLHESLEESTEAHALARSLSDGRDATTRYRIYLLTDRELSDRARNFPDDSISSIPVELHIWDINRLFRVVESQRDPEETDIDFSTIVDGGLPCLDASVESSQYRAYLCVIRGDVLAKIYDEYGSRLLEGNVRSFLSSKGKVNKGIRATIRGEPSMFFAYNNGIAVTASDVVTRSSNHGRRLSSVKNLQIVNGGQTTASLAAALREGSGDLSQIFVQMKLSVVSSDKAGDIIPLIARYANSQNKVSEADFFSNHDFHRRMESISRRLWAPASAGAQHETRWFYERARGSYVNEQSTLTKAQRARFVLQHPKRQLVSKTDLAKVENAWAGCPHIVSLGAQKNFLSFAETIGVAWNASEAKFNEDYFKRAIAKIIIWQETEKVVSSATWYQGGYRANIVAYTVAKLPQLVAAKSAGQEVNLSAVWASQSVPASLRAQLALTAERMFHVLVNPPAGYQNVTEWSKREQCWDRASDVDVGLADGNDTWLVSATEARDSGKAATKQQKEDNKISRVLRVVDLGPLVWQGVATFGQSHSMWTAKEREILSKAGRFGFVPSDKQAEVLMSLYERAVSEGFVPNGTK